MIKKRLHIMGSRILIMGLTFKENCPDIRNSKVADVARELQKYGAQVEVYDPWVNTIKAEHEYSLRLVRRPKPKHYDAIVVAVAHKEFREMGIDNVRSFAKREHVIFDIKYLFDAEAVDGRL
jgi:UDP-N-acetyl-D-galactosamine dehydrogenase